MKDSTLLFENLLSDLSIGISDENLAPAAGEDAAVKNAAVPPRIRILAEGFARGLSLEEVNAKLNGSDCEALYARSFYEAELIYAFTHHLSYEKWKALSRSCADLYAEAMAAENHALSSGKITLKQLEDYVRENSEEQLCTAMMTRFLEKKIEESESEEEFRAVMQENLRRFSDVREKARYYFCKYIYLYVRSKCDDYYESCRKAEKLRAQQGYMAEESERSHMENLALEELSFLKPLTPLKKDALRARPLMTAEEKKEYLEGTSLTPGGIFDEYNYFYFGYVSVEWMEILFELYGSLSEWPENMRIRVAHAMGFCSMNPSAEEKKEALKKLAKAEEDELRKEKMQDETYSRADQADAGRLYQRGRTGEDYFRDFISGKRDINRTTLISFLLFVKMSVKLEENVRITISRLNHILANCGFPQLHPDRPFDAFVRQFLSSSEPMDALEDHVEKTVTNGQDFYLYKAYKDAYCHQSELLEYIGRRS